MCPETSAHETSATTLMTTLRPDVRASQHMLYTTSRDSQLRHETKRNGTVRQSWLQRHSALAESARPLHSHTYLRSAPKEASNHLKDELINLHRLPLRSARIFRDKSDTTNTTRFDGPRREVLPKSKAQRINGPSDRRYHADASV